MKKLSRIIILLFGVFVLFMFENVKASVSSTVFIGNSITIDKLDMVEITSNDICIDINTSKVTNDFLIKNTNNEELITKITAKLEDENSNFSIKDLVIKVNNLQIKNIEKDKDNYSFFIKIEPEEYEKIEISYSTENDLKNAKIIKYNLDSFKGKKVKKFNFDVKIPEEDVPLVKKIYPECFEYEDNDINVKYYDFTVNNLTKDFIIEKETYKNLLYGEDASDNEFDIAVYKNAKDMILNGVNNSFSKYVKGDDSGPKWFEKRNYFSNIMEIKMPYENYEERGEAKEIPETLESVLEYIIYKQMQRDDKTIINDAYIFEYKGDYPLTKDTFYRYNFSKLDGNLYDKKVCVDYVESEGDKELYIKYIEYPDVKTIKKDELSILKKRISCVGELDTIEMYKEEHKNGCYRIINVGLNINNEQIDVTEKEKIEYVNMINADLYIRKVIYDGSVKTYDQRMYGIKDGILIPEIGTLVAYYNENNKENAINYIKNTDYYEDEKGYKDESIKKFDNEIMEKYSRVPTITDCVGFRTTENGKNIITYFMQFQNQRTHLGYVNNVLKGKSAKSLIQVNNEENEKIKQEVEEEIEDAKITDDTDEFVLTKEEKRVKEKQEEKRDNNKWDMFGLNKNELIFMAIIGCAILLNIIIIMKNKRRRKNGK